MEWTFNIKGYEIHVSQDGEHKVTDLTDEMCEGMTDVEDKGPRHSEDSRYIYSIPQHKSMRGIRFGSARAVIQSFIMSQVGFSMYVHRVTIKKL